MLYNFRFRLMAALFWFRYHSELPQEAVREAGIKPADTVLDFACGPGGFSVEAARVVGKKGRVYALDLHPLAARYVVRRARQAGVTNIITVTSGLETGLATDSVDVVLLYDIFHHLKNPEQILAELFRVLMRDGVLSVSDHHMKEKDIITGITESGLFRWISTGKRTITFGRSPQKKTAAMSVK